MVYVLGQDGKPLMPTSRNNKVAYLIKSGKAKVVNRKPFTIQLMYATTAHTQPVTLGIDPGYGNVGFSAIANNKELISGTYILDNKVSYHLKDKAMYRRLRRNKLRYRKQRYLNRRIPKGWLPPSITHRLYLHTKLIDYIKDIIPVTHTIIEIANFDVDRLVKEDKAATARINGQTHTYTNLLSYLIAREQSKCQYCKKDLGNDTWDYIYVIPLDKGGTPVSHNAALVHSVCKQKIEKNGLHKKINKSKQYKSETFMNTIRWRLLSQIEQSSYTFGYITFEKRKQYNLDKAHNTDAFIIAGGTIHQRSIPYNCYYYRRHNRSLQLNRKGYTPAIRKQRYPLQPGDLVSFNNKTYTVRGTHSYGKRVNIYDEEGNIITKQVKDVQLVRYAKTLTFE